MRCDNVRAPSANRLARKLLFGMACSLLAIRCGWPAACLAADGPLPPSQTAPSQIPLGKLVRDAKRIVFLGDSITYDGRWVAILTAWLESCGTTAEVIDVGLSSETVSGLTENGHAGGKFARPDLANRLGSVLRVTRPDLVFACYGMNDGIYQPLDKERFAKFQDGINRLHATVEQSGATIIHLTPPVYDGRPDKQHPAGQADYDAVLAEYSKWLVSKRADGWMVIDVHGPMKESLQAKQAIDPAFTFSPDAVHPSDLGHWAICRAVLQGLGDKAAGANESPLALAAFLPEVMSRLKVLRDAYLSAAGHSRPGVPEGLPLAEAEAQARQLTESLRSRRIYLNGEKLPSGEWKASIQWPQPRVVDPGPAPATPAVVPPDAVVLFDGQSLGQWSGGEKWSVAGGIATVQGGSIQTKASFGDCHIHIEFRAPSLVTGTGQSRGNSGVYLMGRYEIQILDSFEDGTDGPKTYPDGQCGALYKQQPPAVNACRKPGQWQTYDILFTRPRFSADGSLERSGCVSVLHNGIAIHSNTIIKGTTAWHEPPAYKPHADALPITLQEHGNPVQFRSIWVRPFEPAAPR